LGDGGLDRLVGVVIVPELLDTCLDIKQKVFLDDVVNDV
jgi:hypothetical protein